MLLFISGNAWAQQDDKVVYVLGQLDSIRKSPSVSRHFADIYFETTLGAVNFFSAADSKVQGLIDRMEKRFADYFFRSVYAHENSAVVPYEWKAYYADGTAPMLRYILFGINAHINGDIWQALTTEFSLQEIRELKPWYFQYQKGLLKDYRRIYNSALASSPKIKLLHVISFGFDRAYGKILLSRWRKRQMKLAELYYTNKPLFNKKLDKLHRKMDRLNKLIRKSI
ncbi:MAG: DUF5995 family protein [Bacteroidota bacterium]|nr:DUF5995 family protein [Bacteroidota bacterium]